MGGTGGGSTVLVSIFVGASGGLVLLGAPFEGFTIGTVGGSLIFRIWIRVAR